MDQLSNVVAIKMHKPGVGNMICIVGTGGCRSGPLRSAVGHDRTIVIDDRPVSCVKETMEQAVSI